MEHLDKNDSVNIVSLYPSRDPILQPRILVALYPIWMIQSIFVLLYLSLIKDSYRVIHSIDPGVSAFPSLVASTILDKPLIVSVRGLHTDETSALPGRSSLIARIRCYLWRFVTNLVSRVSEIVLPNSDHIIVKSRYQKMYLHNEHDIERKNISIIPTGVDFEKFEPNTEESIIGEKLPDSETDINILNLGRLTQSKGIYELVKRVSESQSKYSVHLYLVGEFSDKDYKQEIETYITNNNISESVTIYDSWLDFDQVPKLIDDVDIVCLLSESGVEGVPRILQESVAMETPIIASDVEGIKDEFQNHCGCHLIERTSTIEFSIAINKSANQTPLRSEFRHKFDIHDNYEKYVDIYKSV